MKVKFESKGGFDNFLKWMDEASNVESDMIKEIADLGKTSLIFGTPAASGETAFGWGYQITATPNTVEIAWTNNAHPESEVNVATLIELGHGTRTGGYVPPRPYIKQSMTPVWNKLDNDIKELMK